MKLRLIKHYTIYGTSFWEIQQVKNNIPITCSTSPYEWLTKNFNNQYKII